MRVVLSKLNEKVQSICRLARVTNVTCSRKVVGPRGESKEVTYQIELPEGASLEEARVAVSLLNMEVDLAAFNAALAGGLITQEVRDSSVRGARQNYLALVARAAGLEGGNTDDSE
jgi:hypothetical protein